MDYTKSHDELNDIPCGSHNVFIDGHRRKDENKIRDIFSDRFKDHKIYIYVKTYETEEKAK